LVQVVGKAAHHCTVIIIIVFPGSISIL